jgi:hypothetical protein
MVSTNLKTQLLLLPFLALSLVLSGVGTSSKSSKSAKAFTGACCQTKVTCQCGTTCCRAPAPLPDRPQFDRIKISTERFRNDQVSWMRVSPRDAEFFPMGRIQLSHLLPFRGHSLVAQHIRLQI